MIGGFQVGPFQTNFQQVATTTNIRNFSLRDWRSWHPQELTRRGLSSGDADVIAEVAERQALDTHLDEQQRLEELQGEMRLRGLEMRSQHLQALNDERERLLNMEIGELMRKAVDDEDMQTLLLMIGL